MAEPGAATEPARYLLDPDHARNARDVDRVLADALKGSFGRQGSVEGVARVPKPSMSLSSPWGAESLYRYGRTRSVTEAGLRLSLPKSRKSTGDILLPPDTEGVFGTTTGSTSRTKRRFEHAAFAAPATLFVCPLINPAPTGTPEVIRFASESCCGAASGTA